MRMLCPLALAAALVLHANATVAHEFWVEPHNYQVAPGEPLVADLRNGEFFNGIAQVWNDRRFTRFETVMAGEASPVVARLGDRPALSSVAEGDGLLIVLHETMPSVLTYTEWEKFLSFAEHKDFEDAAATHEARGWPMDRFGESYTRHVKALIAVGSGQGDDRAFGMQTEFVALSNPYALEFDGQMEVLLNYLGEPRADAQVEVFDKAPDGTIEVTLGRTDADGRATIPVTPGHSYLFDAVVLRPAEDAGSTDKAPVWETLWAALTFAVPEE